MEGGIDARSPAKKLHPMGISVGQGIAEGMMLPDSTDALGDAAQALAEELLRLAELETGLLAKTLYKVGAAFNKRIARGIREEIGIIIQAIDGAMAKVRQKISDWTWRVSQPLTPPPGGPPSDSKQAGGYSALGGVHHPGEFIIPAQITRALMRPTSHTSNINFYNDVSSNIDVAHLNAMVRNIVRKEIASAH